MNLERGNTFLSMGFRLDTKEDEIFSSDFEEALIEIMYMSEEDSRLLSVLMSWAKHHSKYVIAEKLDKHYKIFSRYRGETIVFNLFSIMCLTSGDHRFKKLIKTSKEIIIYPNRKSSESNIRLKGASPIFEQYNIKIPISFIRLRESDVLSKEEIVKVNPQLKNRFIFGPNWRSDIIFKIQEGAQSPSQISKELGCSSEPVYRIWKDYRIATS